MDDAQEIKRLLDETRHLLAPMGYGNAQITVSAGGVGLWIAVTACAVIMAVTVVASVFVAVGMADLNRQTQELRQADATFNAYLVAGYIQPKEEPEE